MLILAEEMLGINRFIPHPIRHHIAATQKWLPLKHETYEKMAWETVAALDPYAPTCFVSDASFCGRWLQLSHILKDAMVTDTVDNLVSDDVLFASLFHYVCTFITIYNLVKMLLSTTMGVSVEKKDNPTQVYKPDRRSSFPLSAYVELMD